MALISKSNPWKTLVILGGVALLVALFYAEENWRGKRAWENCKHELEAKGVVLDWNAYIPPPVPDDQNFFKAPKMQEWFVKPPLDSDFTNELTARLSLDGFSHQFPNASTVTIADVTVLSSSNNAVAGSNMADIELGNSSSPDVRKRLAELLKNALGANAIGSQRPVLLVRSPNQVRPVRIVCLSESVPPDTEIIELFTELFPNGSARLGSPRIWVESAGTNAVRVMSDAAAAGDYLAWSDQFEPDFDLIREALKRPYARMDGDYSDPVGIPIPNFVNVRIVAQMLAQRAQCYLLLGQSEKALGEVILLHDFCRSLEGAPTGKPMTLVAAMINVAVVGLYTDTIADGIRLKAWSESQLIALQKQLEEIDLLPFVAEAFHEEQIGSCRIIEIYVLKNKKNPKFPYWPRGWIYQNLVTVAMLDQKVIDSFDPAKGLVVPHVMDSSHHEIETKLSHRSPYNFFATIFIPNFTKAMQTTMHNQTLANEAQIACAVERYRLAHGEYPETLDALVPQFIEKLPHDIIGGQPSPGSGSASQPLHYRRTDNGKFLLYSVGWNEKDDGGQVALKKDGSEDREKGDWVWKN